MTRFASEKIPVTDLAKQLAHNLFSSIGNCPVHVCADTGMVFEPCTEYMQAHDMNPHAMGAHYEAFGFFYILCFDMDDYEEYVAVHDSEGKMVGTMLDANTIQVGVWTGS